MRIVAIWLLGEEERQEGKKAAPKRYAIARTPQLIYISLFPTRFLSGTSGQHIDFN
jgi:hypothetical protein